MELNARTQTAWAVPVDGRHGPCGTQFGTGVLPPRPGHQYHADLEGGPGDANARRRCVMPDNGDRFPAALEWVLLALMLLSAIL